MIANEILHRWLSLNLTWGQRLRLQRSAKVNNLIVGLEIPTSNFRTNIDTGNVFIPLCFFRKSTPNYVYIDLKRSLSDSALGQCKFDLKSMPKTSKLCQDVYLSFDSFWWDKDVYITLWLLWTNSKFPQTLPMFHSIFLSYIAKNWWRHFLTGNFTKFYAS